MAVHIVYLLVGLSLVYFLRIRYSTGLSKFNDPFLASFTDFWKLWYACTHSQKTTYVDLHQKYGDAMRIGPSELSFADPQAIREIYGPRGVPQKSKEYAVQSTPVRGQVTEVLFSDLDIGWHDRQRRLINSTFSMSKMVKYEPCVDENITLFIEQLEEVIYDLTFGERIGYVEEEKDVNGVIFGVRKVAAWWLYLSRAPFLDYVLLKNPLILWYNKHGWFDHPNVFMPIVQCQFFERQEHWKEVGNMKTVSGDRPTLTEMFLKAQQEHPEVQDFQPFMHSMSTIGAATEATAITLSSVIYFLLKNPRCYEKLKSELSTLPAPASPVIFSQAQSLPYLNARINESMRLHSADRFAKGREVPESGMTICGQFVPGGTTVSVYADVAHRQKEIFGNNLDVFKPERWLESDEKTNRMNATMLSFGIGKYGCLGKNLSRLEMLKFIPSVLRAFDFELVNPEQDWTLVNGPFAHPVDLFVKVQARS